MTIGQNTVSGKMLQAYVERVEALRQQKKELGEDEKLVMQEAKASGFSTARIRDLIRLRAMKPHDLAEAEAQLDMYRHAIGMADEPPLFRALGAAGDDELVRETVIEKMKLFVPAHGQGEITATMGGKPVRLLRNAGGEVEVHDVKEERRPPGGGGRPSAQPRRPRAEVPDTDDDGAEELGRQAARDNKPVVENPFPFGDGRRARFDAGWRKENGGDGMGPGEDDE